MKHKHHELIAQWNEDNSIEFEFAYGTGVDFTWQDCDIRHVINNPSAQIRIKARKPKKEKRWILECSGTLLTTRLFTAESSAQQFLGQSGHSTDCVQFIEIEVEV